MLAIASTAPADRSARSCFQRCFLGGAELSDGEQRVGFIGEFQGDTLFKSEGTVPNPSGATSDTSSPPPPPPMSKCASCSDFPSPESCYVKKFAPGDPNLYWASAASCIQRCFPQGVPLDCRHLSTGPAQETFPSLLATYGAIAPCG